MNSNERLLMETIHQCVREMSVMTPKNPADLKSKLENYNIMLRCSRALNKCLMYLSDQDYSEARYYADLGWRFVDPKGVKP